MQGVAGAGLRSAPGAPGHGKQGLQVYGARGSQKVMQMALGASMQAWPMDKAAGLGKAAYCF